MTALSRKADLRLPEGVTLKTVDYDDRDNLTAALQDMDAVVDATSHFDVAKTKVLIEAAVAAGVSRFVPSDYGLDPEYKEIASLPVFQPNTAALQLLKQKGAEGVMTWTSVACGSFLDRNLSSGIVGIQIYEKKLKLFDDGEAKAPWTTLEWIGRAIAEALVKADQTKNRVVYVSNCLKSQREIADLAKTVLGAEGWQEEKLDVELGLKNAMTEVGKGNTSFPVFADMIRYAMAMPGLCRAWWNNDNKLLGVKPFSDEEIKDVIKTLSAQEKGSAQLF